MGTDGHMWLLMEQPEESLRAVVEESADVCPVRAITIED
jgi:ferredoxin